MKPDIRAGTTQEVKLLETFFKALLDMQFNSRLRNRQKLVRSKSISLLFVSPKKIQQVNKSFRGKNRPTDVLSFPTSDFFGDHSLGEILLCRSVIRNQASEYQVTYNEELIRMTAHSLLHLLGYDHEVSPREERIQTQMETYLLKRLSVALNAFMR